MKQRPLDDYPNYYTGPIWKACLVAASVLYTVLATGLVSYLIVQTVVRIFTSNELALVFFPVVFAVATIFPLMGHFHDTLLLTEFEQELERRIRRLDANK